MVVIFVRKKTNKKEIINKFKTVNEKRNDRKKRTNKELKSRMMHGADGERKLVVLTFGEQLSLFDFKCNLIRFLRFFFLYGTIDSNLKSLR